MKGQRKPVAWKFVAPEFVYGAETRFLAGRYARNLGLRRALVVTDPNVRPRDGLRRWYPAWRQKA